MASDLIENVVAAALLLPKLDANLIGDLATIELGSTDHLCLQGHSRDAILVSFLPLTDAEAAWNGLGLSGRFVDCHRTPAEIREAAAAAGERRVFYFRLNHNMRVATFLDQCQELVASQSVPLVSIQLGGLNKVSPGPVVKSSHNLPIISIPSARKETGAAEKTAASALRQMPATPEENGANALRMMPVAVPMEDDEDWSALDQLVDDLDAFDI